MSEVSKEEAIDCLKAILDSVDYTNGNCSSNEMIGAVLPQTLITICRNVIKRSNQ